MAIFKFCIVSDDVRLELGNKASIIGFYGILPHVEINVENPAAPVAKLTFLLASGEPVGKGIYRIRLSLKSPQAQELMLPADVARLEAETAPANVIIACQPFPLAGVGLYTVTALVNGQPDFSSTLRIGRAPQANR